MLMFSADPVKKNLVLDAGSSLHERMKHNFLNLETRFWYQHSALFP